MLSGVKFISCDEIDKSDDIKKKSKKSARTEKHRSKNKSSWHSISDEDLGRIKKGSRKKKWYSSEEYSSSSYSSESEDDNSSYDGEKRHHIRKNSKYEAADMPKKRSRSGKEKYGGKKSKERGSLEDISDSNLSDGGAETNSLKDKEIVRKEIGLGWMLRPAKTDGKPTMPVEDEPEKAPTNERSNREYLKDVSI